MAEYNNGFGNPSSHTRPIPYVVPVYPNIPSSPTCCTRPVGLRLPYTVMDGHSVPNEIRPSLQSAYYQPTMLTFRAATPTWNVPNSSYFVSQPFQGHPIPHLVSHCHLEGDVGIAPPSYNGYQPLPHPTTIFQYPTPYPQPLYFDPRDNPYYGAQQFQYVMSQEAMYQPNGFGDQHISNEATTSGHIDDEQPNLQNSEKNVSEFANSTEFHKENQEKTAESKTGNEHGCTGGAKTIATASIAQEGKSKDNGDQDGDENVGYLEVETTKESSSSECISLVKNGN